MLKNRVCRIDKSIRPYYDPRDSLQRSVRVRGDDEQSGHLFSYLSPEQRVPADHPLRTIRVMTDDALRRLSPRFDAIYADDRPPLDSSRASVAGTPASSAVFRAQ